MPVGELYFFVCRLSKMNLYVYMLDRLCNFYAAHFLELLKKEKFCQKWSPRAKQGILAFYTILFLTFKLE